MELGGIRSGVTEATGTGATGHGFAAVVTTLTCHRRIAAVMEGA